MRIDFIDCTHAALSYALPDQGAEGDIHIQRAFPGESGLCEALDVVQ